MQRAGASARPQRWSFAPSILPSVCYLRPDTSSARPAADAPEPRQRRRAHAQRRRATRLEQLARAAETDELLGACRSDGAGHRGRTAQHAGEEEAAADQPRDRLGTDRPCRGFEFQPVDGAMRETSTERIPCDRRWPGPLVRRWTARRAVPALANLHLHTGVLIRAWFGCGLA